MSDTPVTPSSNLPGIRQLGIVVLILVAGLVLTKWTADVKRTTEPGIRLINERPFLPDVVGAWHGGEQVGLTDDERSVLPPDTDGAHRAYTNATGSVFGTVVLSGRDVTSIHRPEVCLTGQGWKLDAAQTERIDTPAEPRGVLRVSRINSVKTIPLQNGREAQMYVVFAYWFVGNKRVTPYHWQRMWWTTVDRVLHGRNQRWAYFLFTISVPADHAVTDFRADQDEAMQRLRKFIQDFYPQVVPN
ncbi:MAG: exosortase C-terminal domain/associated protein EpsI [Verrucomicrobiota bacterium]